ncbi:MAG: MG2 domain-containing protein [Gemmataceae bacterium]
MSRTSLVAGVALSAALLLTAAPEKAPGPQLKATAAYQTTERLNVTLDVPASTKARVLTVELVDNHGKSLSLLGPVLPAGGATQTTVTFAKVKAKPADLTVRAKLDGPPTETPLDKILLVRAHETAVTASAEFFAGSEAELLCKVHGVRSATRTVPLVADVSVSLLDKGKEPRQLFRGKTGGDGAARVNFQVPDVPAGTYTLKVHTRSDLGEEALTREVKVVSSPKVLLTTDKPLYQPGQTVRLRALALRAFDLKPAAKANLLFEVEDAKGNKVYKKELNTSEYGIASADFTLADEVNLGEYRLRALLGEHRAEKTVTVAKYVLPKFKAELKTDKAFYLPKETIKGTLQVDYFFGKPVAGGKVEVKASTFDVAFREFAQVKGATDKAGHYEFEIKLPDYFVGQPLAGGNALLKLDVKVTDTADHAESLTRTRAVSDQPIRVSFLPEGGRIFPGLENRIFVAALYPDGSPAPCAVELFQGQKAAGKPFATVRTNAVGLAEFKLTPRPEQLRAGPWAQETVEMLGGVVQTRGVPKNLLDLSAKARDDKGAEATAKAELTSEPLGENVLLRLDKAVYAGGDKLRLDVLTSAGLPTAYVDVVKSGQTLLTRWLDVKDGKASTSLDLPPTVFGTLELHAYQVLASGEVVRDARVVYVNPADELKIRVTPDREEYRPGEKGVIRFEVTDARGAPAPAALGVLVVDEAVYAMQEVQPGLEKVFFSAP